MVTPVTKNGRPNARTQFLELAKRSDRFWSYVNKGDCDECWPWISGLTATDVGRIYISKTVFIRAPRAAYMLAAGKPLRPRYGVFQSCSNRLCCNPAHLFADGSSRAGLAKAHQRSRDKSEEMMVGRRFGRLLVIAPMRGFGSRGSSRWRCICDCGTERMALGCRLRDGSVASCGCAHVEETDALRARVDAGTLLELWRPIPGYEERYEVSSQGRARSLPRVTVARQERRSGRLSELMVRRWSGKLLTPALGSNGYLTVRLAGVAHSLHGLVLSAFCGPKPDGGCACHWDGVRTNNRLTNLRWGTYSENNKDIARHKAERAVRGGVAA